MKASCGGLEIYTVNPTTTTKVKRQRVTANKPRKEIKRSHKNIQLIQKKQKKMKKGTKMKPNVSKITFEANDQNTQLKGRICQSG